MHKGKIENGLHPKIRVEVAGKTSSQKFLELVDNKLMIQEPSASRRRKK